MYSHGDMKPYLTFDIQSESETFGLFINQLADKGIAFDLRKEGSEITVWLNV